MKHKLILLPLALSLISNGCAHMNSQTASIAKDGTKITTTISATTLFDSNNQMAKASNHVTDKTSGTTLSGVDQSATGSNFVTSLQSVEKIINALPK